MNSSAAVTALDRGSMRPSCPKFARKSMKSVQKIGLKWYPLGAMRKQWEDRHS